MILKEAKKILPKKDFEAFEAVFANQLSRTSAVKLKQRLALARKLKKKYRDLAHAEVASIKSRRTNEVDTDINDRRVRLFETAIETIEDALEKLNS